MKTIDNLIIFCVKKHEGDILSTIVNSISFWRRTHYYSHLKIKDKKEIETLIEDAVQRGIITKFRRTTSDTESIVYYRATTFFVKL